MKFLTETGPGARFRPNHEVIVATAEQQHFEYVGCHPETGLLRVADTGQGKPRG
ncbi:phenylacetaldoxime dehydratase family protein [Amycolatopsis jejuensis]|uniref:phenylacetaldoxime dehydratase family protein n=1 Tax=Amycolatopsis jejuensis TaxID=330084 RepID=UPI000A03BB65|nr:phenylacetaldoxime dehydratase family protein [Amycolatopsis jejuensis]